MTTEGRDGGCIPEEDSVSFADEYINQWGGMDYIVEVKVYATEMSKHKVADCIRSLNRLSIIVKSIEKPGVLCCNQLA